MKILDILRLLSGNPAKSRLLLWLLFSWLSSRAFCKPGLWIWENALWPFLWPQSNLLRQVISLSLPKGKNQGLVNCPGSPRLRCSLVGGSHSPGHMPSPSIRCALAALRRACQQAQLTVPWTWWSSSGRRKAHFREPYTVKSCEIAVQSPSPNQSFSTWTSWHPERESDLLKVTTQFLQLPAHCIFDSDTVVSD